MIVTTIETIPDMRIKRVLGIVQGSTIRARHLGHAITAIFKNLTGGEITEFTKLMAESREQCMDRMREEAVSLGANAIIGMRFTTSDVMQNASEMLVYGTAVIIEDK